MNKKNLRRLAPPPRFVPLRLRLFLCLGRLSTIAGVVGFGFSMMCFWAFGMAADFSQLQYIGRELETAEGILESVEDTDIEINERTMCQYNYSFLTDEGRKCEDFSYAVWRPEIKEGTKVTIEFPAGKPELSRIRGMRRQLLSVWLILIGIVPLASLLIMFFGIKKGCKEAHLLAHGEVGKAHLKSKTRTDTSINGQRVYKFCFEFTDPDGRKHEIHYKTHQTKAITDEDEESILYDRNDPTRAMLVDALRSGPMVDARGQLFVTSRMGIVGLVLALAVFVPHGCYLAYLLTR